MLGVGADGVAEVRREFGEPGIPPVSALEGFIFSGSGIRGAAVAGGAVGRRELERAIFEAIVLGEIPAPRRSAALSRGRGGTQLRHRALALPLAGLARQTGLPLAGSSQGTRESRRRQRGGFRPGHHLSGDLRRVRNEARSQLRIRKLPLSRLTLSRLTLSRLTLSRLTLSRLTLSRLTLSRLTLSRLTLSRLTLFRPTWGGRVLSGLCFGGLNLARLRLCGGGRGLEVGREFQSFADRHVGDFRLLGDLGGSLARGPLSLGERFRGLGQGFRRLLLSVRQRRLRLGRMGFTHWVGGGLLIRLIFQGISLLGNLLRGLLLLASEFREAGGDRLVFTNLLFLGSQIRSGPFEIFLNGRFGGGGLGRGGVLALGGGLPGGFLSFAEGRRRSRIDGSRLPGQLAGFRGLPGELRRFLLGEGFHRLGDLLAGLFQTIGRLLLCRFRGFGVFRFRGLGRFGCDLGGLFQGVGGGLSIFHRRFPRLFRSLGDLLLGLGVGFFSGSSFHRLFGFGLREFLSILQCFAGFLAGGVGPVAVAVQRLPGRFRGGGLGFFRACTSASAGF